jgi:hypothetical protein
MYYFNLLTDNTNTPTAHCTTLQYMYTTSAVVEIKVQAVETYRSPLTSSILLTACEPMSALNC